jgi:DNA-binding NarL/FixJ family response regulator
MQKTTDKTIRLLLADDHLVVRMGLSSILEFESNLKVIAMAENGQQAVDLHRQHLPDIVMMDLRMPDMDGIEALKKIRAEFPNAKVIMLTTYNAEEDIRRAMEAGASGYLLKHLSGEELVASVQKVYAGKQCMPQEVVKRTEGTTGATILSPRQLEVLELLAKGLSNKEIAAALGVTEDGAKAHLKSIFGKLGVRGRTEAIVAAIQRGIIQVD